jgi:hypothetical protein
MALYHVVRIPKRGIKGIFKHNYFSKYTSREEKKDLFKIASVKSKYLRIFLIMMFISFILGTLIDYQFKLKLTQNALTEQDLSGFLGMFRGIANTGLSIFQNYLFSRLIPFIGTINIFNIYPIILAINAFFLVYFAGFYASFIMKLTAEIFKKMFEDPAIQFGYNPIPLLYKGRVISSVEGTIKPFAMILTGSILIYAKRFDPQFIFISILMLSVLYLLVSLLLKKEYFNAFYKKIKTESALLKPKIPKFDKKDLSDAELKKMLDDNKIIDSEFSLYFLAKIEKKIEKEFLEKIVAKYGDLHPSIIANYLTKYYGYNTIVNSTQNGSEKLKEETIKGLIKNKKLQTGLKKRYKNIKKFYRSLPLRYSKELYYTVDNEKIDIKNSAHLIRVLKKTPYKIKKIVKNLQSVEFKRSDFEELFILVRTFNLTELFSYFESVWEKLNSEEIYRIIQIQIKNGLSVDIGNDIKKNVILQEIEHIKLFLAICQTNKNIEYMNNFSNYIEERSLDLLITAVSFFMESADKKILLESRIQKEYVVSEMFLYLEEKIQKMKGKYKRVMKEAYKIVSMVYDKKKIKYLSPDFKVLFSPIDTYYINYYKEKKIDLIESKNLILKESKKMDILMEKLMLLRKVEIFNEIDLEKLEGLALMAVTKKYKRDDIIIRKDEIGDRLYIIQKGKAEIYKRVGPLNSPIKMITCGDWFGELSLISDKEHLASVRALSDLVTLEIPKSIFRTFVIQNPEISFKIFQILVSYMKSSEMIGEGYEIR